MYTPLQSNEPDNDEQGESAEHSPWTEFTSRGSVDSKDEKHGCRDGNVDRAKATGSYDTSL